MDSKAIIIAESRLRTASNALNRLQTASDTEKFCDDWFVFLTAWKGIYTVLEQGSKVTPQSRQWFGAKKKQRRHDPLLYYLFEARNDEEHGLAQSVIHGEGGHAMRAIKDVAVESMRLKIDTSTGAIEAIGSDGEPVAEFLQYTLPGPRLCPVHPRGRPAIHPPCEHLGNRIDITPKCVAEVALKFAELLVAEAKAMAS